MFASVVALEAKKSNPTMNLFAAMLLCGLRNRQKIEADGGEKCEVSVEASLEGGAKRCGCKATLSGAIINFANLYCRLMTNQKVLSLNKKPEPATWNLSEYYGADLKVWARRNKIRNRFWLAVLLTHNPSLRKLRKHALAPLPEWVFEEDCQLFWSQERCLYYHWESLCYYDPDTEQWFHTDEYEQYCKEHPRAASKLHQ